MTHPHNPPPPESDQPYSPHAPQHEPWGVDPEVQREQQQLAQEKARRTKAYQANLLDRFVRAVIYLVVALEVLLGIRFLLRLAGANPENTFAGFIYAISEPFVSPFSTLFISPTFEGSANIFDVNLLVAMVVYVALLALFLGLIRVLFEQ
jgi:uncharacterized protein YggT (Ycf19 family)